LSKQLLRSGTSIGADIEEAIGGQTDKDFFCQTYYCLQRSQRNALLDSTPNRYRLHFTERKRKLTKRRKRIIKNYWLHSKNITV
jgi:four helix bundle protein